MAKMSDGHFGPRPEVSCDRSVRLQFSLRCQYVTLGWRCFPHNVEQSPPLFGLARQISRVVYCVYCIGPVGLVEWCNRRLLLSADRMPGPDLTTQHSSDYVLVSPSANR